MRSLTAFDRIKTGFAQEKTIRFPGFKSKAKPTFRNRGTTFYDEFFIDCGKKREKFTTVPFYISQVVAPAGHRPIFWGLVDREVFRTGRRWASTLSSSAKSLSTSMKTRKPRPGFASTIARVHNSPHQVSDHFFFLFLSAMFFLPRGSLKRFFFQAVTMVQEKGTNDRGGKLPCYSFLKMH
jgi:hypothetical protein